MVHGGGMSTMLKRKKKEKKVDGDAQWRCERKE